MSVCHLKCDQAALGSLMHWKQVVPTKLQEVREGDGSMKKNLTRAL